MKNILFILFFIFLLVGISNVVTENELIPEDAIRIRVIASSDKKEDQELKFIIKNEVEKYLYEQLSNVDNINDAHIVIKNSLVNIDKIVKKYTDDFDINYGLNYFPEKEFKGIKYKDGEYQSLVITIGNGLGNNWWCVLFPPLCMIEEDTTDVEYRSFIVDTLNKYNS